MIFVQDLGCSAVGARSQGSAAVAPQIHRLDTDRPHLNQLVDRNLAIAGASELLDINWGDSDGAKLDEFVGADRAEVGRGGAQAGEIFAARTQDECFPMPVRLDPSKNHGVDDRLAAFDQRGSDGVAEPTEGGCFRSTGVGEAILHRLPTSIWLNHLNPLPVAGNFTSFELRAASRGSIRNPGELCEA